MQPFGAVFDADFSFPPLSNVMTILTGDSSGQCRYPAAQYNKFLSSFTNCCIAVASAFGSVGKDDSVTFTTSIVDLFLAVLADHANFLQAYADARDAQEAPLTYLVRIVTGVNDFLNDQSSTLKSVNYGRVFSEVQAIVKKLGAADTSKLVSIAGEISEQLRGTAEPAAFPVRAQIAEWTRFYAHTVIFSIEAASFATSQLADFAESIEVIGQSLRTILGYINTILACRCEFQVVEPLLKEKLMPRLKRAYDGLVPMLMSFLTLAPTAWQEAVHGKLAISLQKIDSLERTLVGNLLDAVKASPQFAAVYPIRRPVDTEISRAVRIGWLIAHGILVHQYPASALVGAVAALREQCAALAPRFTVTADQKPWILERQNFFLAAMSGLEAAAGVEQTGPDGARDLAFAAIRVALAVGAADSEPLAADSLRKIVTLIAGTTKDRLSATPFLLFRAALQGALYQTATIATGLFMDIIAQLPHALDKPPSTVRIATIGSALRDYLTEIDHQIPIEASAAISSHVDQALVKMETFLTTSVSLEDEVYEGKFRRAISVFRSYCAVFVTLREQQTAVQWNCDTASIATLAEKAERLIPAVTTEGGAQTTGVQFAHQVLELELLLCHFHGGASDLASLALSLLDGLGTPELQEAIATLEQRLQLLKEAAPDLRQRRTSHPPQPVGGRRVIAFEKRDALKAQLEGDEARPVDTRPMGRSKVSRKSLFRGQGP
jgi:hypothetical protein